MLLVLQMYRVPLMKLLPRIPTLARNSTPENNNLGGIGTGGSGQRLAEDMVGFILVIGSFARQKVYRSTLALRGRRGPQRRDPVFPDPLVPRITTAPRPLRNLAHQRQGRPAGNRVP